MERLLLSVRMFLKMSLWLMVLLGCTATVQAGEGSLSLQELQVAPRVTIAGALRPEAVARLRATNAVVVDMRQGEEGATEEGRAMAAAGVDWIALPQDGGVPASADVQLLGQLLAARPDQPVVLHCASGNRAGKLWAAYRINSGVPVESAIAEVASIVTRAPLLDAIRQYSSSEAP
ncbi:MAG: sulfur transferase domain-containing protein [Pseudomonadales bacterium]